MRKSKKGTLENLLAPCETRDALWEWVRCHLGLEVPRRAFCDHHSAPFEYLAAAYFEPGQDLVVWGPRGGGKTRLAAAATLLDLLHKPGLTVRILGGSLEQSLRTWEHLVPDLERLVPDLLVKSRSRARRVTLTTGSTAAALAQSQRSVRGQRVQKMRCDEVDLFDPAVWEAAGATTRSLLLPDGRAVAGVVEALSTYHTPGGTMGRVLERAGERGPEGLARGTVVRWCILDVMAPCRRDASACATCDLLGECGGRARQTRPDGTPYAQGFVPVEDVVAIKRRVSVETWQAELLCQGPTQQGRVFPGFSEATHVRAFDVASASLGAPCAAVDFGYRNPFVALIVARSADGVLHVLDEYLATERTVAENIAAMRKLPWPVRHVACDPAGGNRNEQTGKSAIALLREAGYIVRSRASGILEGVEKIRVLLRPAAGPPRLFVHPRCATLIRALREYRYDQSRLSELPHKDGTHDHPIDALRYYLANEPGSHRADSRPGY